VLADCELEENDDTPDGEKEAIKDDAELPTLPEAADDVVGEVVTNDELEAPAEVTPEVGIPGGILAIETEDAVDDTVAEAIEDKVELAEPVVVALADCKVTTLTVEDAPDV